LPEEDFTFIPSEDFFVEEETCGLGEGFPESFLLFFLLTIPPFKKDGSKDSSSSPASWYPEILLLPFEVSYITGRNKEPIGKAIEIAQEMGR